MSPERAEVLSWLSKADHDRRAAQLAVAASPPITDVAGFHLQQAAEKLLKAFLVARRIPFEKIHDLSELIEQCIDVDADFTALWDRLSSRSDGLESPSHKFFNRLLNTYTPTALCISAHG